MGGAVERGHAPQPSVLDRLRRERNAWLCTLRPDGSAHLTPVWFVYLAPAVWVCSSERSVKAANLASDPRVSLALEDGDAPVVVEGRAFIHRTDFPAEVVAAFAGKYAQWDITAPFDARTRRVLFQIVMDRWLLAGRAQ